MWLLAGLWHLVIVPGLYSRGGEAAHHEGGGLILVGYLLLAIIMAWMCRVADRGGRPVAEGLKLGLLIGLLWVTPHALVREGAHSHGEAARYGYLLVNGAWHLVEQGVGGGIMGLVFGWPFSRRKAHA